MAQLFFEGGSLSEGTPATLRKAKALLLSRVHPPPFDVATANSAPKKARRNSMDMDTDHERDSSRSNSLIGEDFVAWNDWSDLPASLGLASSKEAGATPPTSLSPPLSMVSGGSDDDETDNLEYLSADDEDTFCRKRRQQLRQSDL